MFGSRWKSFLIAVAGLGLLLGALGGPPAWAQDNGLGPDTPPCPSQLLTDRFSAPLENDTLPMAMAPFRLPSFYDEQQQRYLDRPVILFMADMGRHSIWMAGEYEALWAGTPGLAGFVDGEAGLFNNPSGIAVDEEGMVYVADRGNHAIRRVYPDGWVETLAGAPDLGVFQYPTSIAYWNKDGERALVVADSGNHCLRRIDLNDAEYAVSTLAGACGEPGASDGSADVALFDEPRSVDVLDDKIFVADRNGVKLLRDYGDGLTVSTILSRPGVQSVFADDEANLYITTQGDSAVEQIRRDSEGFRPPRPLEPCGESIESPRATATFFGKLIVADGGLLRGISDMDPEYIGLKRDCPRCGPRIPIHE